MLAEYAAREQWDIVDILLDIPAINADIHIRYTNDTSIHLLEYIIVNQRLMEEKVIKAMKDFDIVFSDTSNGSDPLSSALFSII